MRDLAFTTLSAAATGVLGTPEPLAKVRLGRAIAAMWRGGSIGDVGSASAPNRPARPARPALRLPRDLPKRKISRDSTGRIALLHALAHIELNAIDLAWDMIARFAGADLPRAFFDDWVGVAVEESGHFALLDQRLAALGEGPQICRLMTDCGRPPRRRRMICWPGSPWFPWSWRPEVSTLPRR